MTHTKDDFEQEKQVQFYSALVNAWLTTKLERDKSLLALSAGNISVIMHRGTKPKGALQRSNVDLTPFLTSERSTSQQPFAMLCYAAINFRNITVRTSL
jgi:hypothetical protein